MAWKRHRILAGLPTALLLLVMTGCGGSSEPEENLVVDLSDPSVTGPGGAAPGGGAAPPPPPPRGQDEARDRGGQGGNVALRPRNAAQPEGPAAEDEGSDRSGDAGSGGDQALNEMLGAFNASGGGGQGQGPGSSGGGPGPGVAGAGPGGGGQADMMAQRMGGGSGGMDQQAMMRERMGGGQEEMMARMGAAGGDPSEMMAQRMAGQNQAQMRGPGGFGEGFGPGGAAGGPGGPGGFGPGGGSSDEPIDFDNPAEVAEAFLDAAENRDLDRLHETTALRAPFEAGNEQRRELFQKIRELSLSDGELEGIGKDLEEYQIVAIGTRRSSGTINYVLRKTLDNGDILQRSMSVRKEKAGWKVVDVNPPWLNDRPNQNRRRGR